MDSCKLVKKSSRVLQLSLTNSFVNLDRPLFHALHCLNSSVALTLSALLLSLHVTQSSSSKRWGEVSPKTDRVCKSNEGIA